MAYAKFKKSYKKFARKVYKKAKPYASKKKGYNNRMKLYNEIRQIKRTLNPEKKVAERGLTGVGVGQTLNGSDGIYTASITPTITQGSTYDTRNGRSIKLSGCYLRGKFTAQTNTINKIKFNMMIIRVIGKSQTLTEINNGMFNADSISGIRDYFAPRNPDSFSDYRIIASKNYTLYPDSITGQTGIVDYTLPLKLRHHIRYSNNTNTIEEGELFVIIRADSGDSGTPLTGAFWQMSIRMTYYDN